MATIEDYDSDRFNSLHSPQWAYNEFITRKVNRIISDDISKLFEKYDVEDDFAVVLLHRHCDLTTDQRLVKVGPVMLPWSSSLINFVEPNLGQTFPQALLVDSGKFYPYEFIHLSAAEVKNLPDGKDDRFGNNSDFVYDFASLIDEKNVTDILGLTLLSDEDKKLAADPDKVNCEVENNGDLECVAITLTGGAELLLNKGLLQVLWMFVDGKLRELPAKTCLGGTDCGGHKGCGLDENDVPTCTCDGCNTTINSNGTCEAAGSEGSTCPCKSTQSQLSK